MTYKINKGILLEESIDWRKAAVVGTTTGLGALAIGSYGNLVGHDETRDTLYHNIHDNVKSVQHESEQKDEEFKQSMQARALEKAGLPDEATYTNYSSRINKLPFDDKDEYASFFKRNYPGIRSEYLTGKVPYDMLQLNKYDDAYKKVFAIDTNNATDTIMKTPESKRIIFAGTAAGTLVGAGLGGYGGYKLGSRLMNNQSRPR